MQTRHRPSIDPRYWTGILLASVFGTNLGDLYAHYSGLGLSIGLLPLLALSVVAFWAEARDRVSTTEAYYWLVIIIIRTGATNLGDLLAYRVRIPLLLLAAGLVAIVAACGAPSRIVTPSQPDRFRSATLPYWIAMLAAGTFGTVVGDGFSHLLGQGVAGLSLTAALLLLRLAARGREATLIAIYWAAILIARSAGTCLGDWLAENRLVGLGLPASTVLTGLTFATVLVLWPAPRRAPLTAG